MSKLYYSIGEVAEMFKVNTSLIRFWEKEFKILKPKKNNKGNRLFTAKDIENIKLIYQLVKVDGYTLDGAKTQLKKDSSKSADQDGLIEKLEKVKAELNKLKSEL